MPVSAVAGPGIDVAFVVLGVYWSARSMSM
jgi:hypothetical protein